MPTHDKIRGDSIRQLLIKSCRGCPHKKVDCLVWKDGLCSRDDSGWTLKCGLVKNSEIISQHQYNNRRLDYTTPEWCPLDKVNKEVIDYGK